MTSPMVVGSFEQSVVTGRPDGGATPGHVEWLVPEPGVELALWEARVSIGQVFLRLVRSPGSALQLLAGAGTELVEGGTLARAKVTGRPRLAQIGPGIYQATVIPVTELQGPLTSGLYPHAIEGDLVIHGDIGHGVHVQASGGIWVRGSAQGAVLESGSGIRIDQMAKHCTLRTRAPQSEWRGLQREFRQLTGELGRLRLAARRVVSDPRFAAIAQWDGVARLVRLLVADRFRALPEAVARCQALTAILPEMPQRGALESVLESVAGLLSGEAVRHLSDLDQAVEMLCGINQWLAGARETAPVSVPNLIRSWVQADGEVHVEGPGVQTCTIEASKAIRVSALRGGNLCSEESVAVGIVLASGAGEAGLEVAPGGYLQVGVALTPALLRIGRWQKRLRPRSHQVRIDSTPDGEVVSGGAGGGR